MIIIGEALYWFFSTVAQTLGVIVGVVGMLTVFKLQSITNYMQQIVDSTFQQRNGIFPNGMAYTQTPKDIIIDFREKYPDINIDVPREDFRTTGMLEVVYLASLRILNSFDRYKKIKNRFLMFFLTPQLLAIFLSLAYLIRSEGLANTINYWSSWFFIWLLFPAFIIYLFTSSLFMIKLLMDD